MGNVSPKNVIYHPSGSIELVIKELRDSVMFIGIGSGLSWLSWSLNVPTVLISGFSEPFAEMQDCIRVSAPQGKCSGCFNRYKLNPSVKIKFFISNAQQLGFKSCMHQKAADSQVNRVIGEC